MGEPGRLALAHTAVSDAAPCARAMTLSVAPAIATELALVYHVILEAMRHSYGNEAHFGSMMQLTIKTMLIGESGRVKLKQHVCREAQKGILRCRLAGIQTGNWTLDQTTYETLCEVLATFDRQLAVTPFYEFMLVDEKLNALIARRKAKAANKDDNPG
jgi:hypothetical protein